MLFLIYLLVFVLFILSCSYPCFLLFTSSLTVLITLKSAGAHTQFGNVHMLDGIFEISIDKNVKFPKVVNILKQQDYLLSLECWQAH